VDLRGVDLRGVDLRGAKLRDADLSGAILSWADLSGTDLNGANLSGANLSETNLSVADLSGANLSGTCLDSDAEIPPITDEEITTAGLEIHGEWVHGWRTAKSQHCGYTKYEPGVTYTAPWFSVCPETKCHPGIYLAGLNWLRGRYIRPYVRVRCLRKDLHRAGDKWRARQIEVIDSHD
jgi:hypothetical protein